MLFVLYQVGLWLEKQSALPEIRGDLTERYLLDGGAIIDGELYRPRDLTTILLMGIDHDRSAKATGYRNGGQADFLQLIVIDKGSNRVHRVQIDRDTMTPITVLGVLGNQVGMRTAQISLSHGFGDGKAQSCEFTVDAVSNLLLGLPIDFYIAMNMDGIPVLNDLVGGVTVTLDEDLSSLDPAMTKGSTMTLNQEQATLFVRSRQNVGGGTNVERMSRQEQYMLSLADALAPRIQNDKEFIGTVYDGLTPYLITDMSRGRLINEIWAMRQYEQESVIHLPGTHQIGEDSFMQFYVDEAELQRIILSLQYQPMK